MNQGLNGTGCFGKRPPAADYIHHHHGGLNVLDWQRWIQEGVGMASARFGAGVEGRLRDFRVFQFAVPAARPDAYLIGALGPGEDRSGRLFPFTVFAEAPLEPSGTVADLVCGRRPVWRRAASILSARDVDLPELFRQVDALAADGPPDPGGDADAAAYLSRVTVGVLTAGRDGEEMSRTLPRVVRNLRTVASQAERDRRPPAYGLRYPLPAQPERGTAARVLFLSLSLRVLGRRGRPSIFWSEAGQPGFLDVHPGTVGPAVFLHLLDPSLAGEAIFAMDEELLRISGEVATADGAESCWTDPGSTLQEALDRCGLSAG